MPDHHNGRNTAGDRTEIEATADGLVLVRSPAGESIIDLWALNDLLHDERTRQEARVVLLAAKMPYHLPDGQN